MILSNQSNHEPKKQRKVEKFSNKKYKQHEKI